MANPRFGFYAGIISGDSLASFLLQHKQHSEQSTANLFTLASWLSEARDQGQWRQQILDRLEQTITKKSVPIVSRQRAVLAFAQTQEPGVLNTLRQLLNYPNPYIQQVSVSAIATLGKEVSLDLLTKHLQENHLVTGKITAQTFAWLGQTSTDKQLNQLLLQGEGPLLISIAEALAFNGDLAEQSLYQAAKSRKPSVRQAAIYGLVLLESKEAIACLHQLQQDKNSSVQTVAKAAIQFMKEEMSTESWASPNTVEQTWMAQWTEKKGLAVPMGAATLPTIQEILSTNQSQPLRLAAIITLGQIPNKKHVSLLQQMRQDTNPIIREMASVSLYCLERAFDERF